MRIRYLSYLALGLAAAFLAVATAAFSLSTVVGLSIGIGIAMLVVSAGLAVRYRKDMPTLVVGVCIAAISLWTVLAALFFSKGTVDDLTFASALAIGALTVVGLTAHELEAERAMHSVEVVREGPGEHTPESRPSAA
jgi:hypothetical protein